MYTKRETIMAKMTRTQIYITQEQHKVIANLAKTFSTTSSNVIRDALEKYLIKTSAQTSDPLADIVGIGKSGLTHGSANHDKELYDE